jgi:IS5 family transposase
MEDAIYDRLSFQKFLWIDIGKKNSVPDETTILNFRHFLEEHHLQERFFEIVKKMMESKWLILNEWTNVDASLIKAPSSTKNKDKKRDSEMSSTKKNGSYHFGMKIHIWSDHKTWLVHSLSCTTAKVADISEILSVITGKERSIFWDKWYRSRILKELCRETGVYYWILDQRTKNNPLSYKQEKKNKQKTDVRKKVEFNFWIIKHLWWHSKVRYRWLEKNSKHFFWLFALSNLFKYNQILKKATA